MATIQDREDWLNRAARALVALILAPRIPDSAPALTDVRITCGFPRGARKGQCKTMPRAQSADGTNEVFISPEMDSPAQILPALATCLIQAAHDAQGWAKGQRALRDAQRIGLHGPTATLADGSPEAHEFQVIAERIAEALGHYPHAKVLAGKKDGTRLVKVECIGPDCGAVWRASMKWAQHMTLCPVCHGGARIARD